jgi:hypothetical protein
VGQVRLVASVLAWLLCCFLSWRNLSAVEAKNTEIKRLKDALGEWQHRVDLFEVRLLTHPKYSSSCGQFVGALS